MALTWTATPLGHYATQTLTARKTADVVLFTASYNNRKIFPAVLLIKNYANDSAVIITTAAGRSYEIPAYSNQSIDCRNIDRLTAQNYGHRDAELIVMDLGGSKDYMSGNQVFTTTPPSINDYLLHCESLTVNSGIETGGSLASVGVALSGSGNTKFGSSAFSFASTDTYTITNVGFFPLSPGYDWTLDFWARVNNNANRSYVEIGTNTAGIAFGVSTSGGRARLTENDVPAASSSGSVISGAGFSHYALTGQAGVISLFINGVRELQYTSALDTIVDRILFNDVSGVTFSAAGGLQYLDEVRYTKSSAVYTANFSVPTAPYY